MPCWLLLLRSRLPLAARRLKRLRLKKPPRKKLLRLLNRPPIRLLLRLIRLLLRLMAPPLRPLRPMALPLRLLRLRKPSPIWTTDGPLERAAHLFWNHHACSALGASGVTYLCDAGYGARCAGTSPLARPRRYPEPRRMG